VSFSVLVGTLFIGTHEEERILNYE